MQGLLPVSRVDNSLASGMGYAGNPVISCHFHACTMQIRKLAGLQLLPHLCDVQDTKAKDDICQKLTTEIVLPGQMVCKSDIVGFLSSFPFLSFPLLSFPFLSSPCGSPTTETGRLEEKKKRTALYAHFADEKKKKTIAKTAPQMRRKIHSPSSVTNRCAAVALALFAVYFGVAQGSEPIGVEPYEVPITLCTPTDAVFHFETDTCLSHAVFSRFPRCLAILAWLWPRPFQTMNASHYLSMPRSSR